MERSPKTVAGAAFPSTETVVAAAQLGFSLRPRPRPGFRFHPTDQELVGCLLRRKVLGHQGLHIDIDIDIDFVPVVNVYKFEPQDLPGKDRPVRYNGTVIGMKKTLVYHIGRAPRGTRTDWVMHEYRLHDDHDHHIQDTYALCRVFNKNIITPPPDLLGGVDMEKQGIQSVAVGPNTNKDEMQPMSGGGGGDVGIEGMQPISGGVELDNEGMHSVPNNLDMDKEGIQPMSDGPNANKEGILPVFCNTNADKERIDPVSGSIAGDMEGSYPVSDNIIADMEGIHSVFGDAVRHNEEIDDMLGGIYADVDFSWMQCVPDDICYPNIELDMYDSCSQLIDDYSW
ncbi:NAC domain containing protein 52-like [Hordeum vulgare subsp. vulgare]|uniref:NAC domain containing protein 52-like n=1 Tax=Hordeum vulgare subsp. vulgare TaxID=112509 RepID=UPI001D1A4D4E|nr:NAC domain containing protein 52-like [Hordeum vulgare subsp. vulgare]